MRSIQTTLRFAQISRRQSSRSICLSPRLVVFPTHPSLSRRFYSENQPPHSEFSNNKSQERPQRDNGEQQQKEDRTDSKKGYEEDTGPPPDPNKSPFQVFVDTFKSELSKSRELQESVKALQDESGKIGDSEALRRAKEAYAKARVLSIKICC